MTAYSTGKQVYLDGVFADTQGVPQLDALVTRTGHNLPVISGEGNAENIVGVATEAAGGHTAGRGEKKSKMSTHFR